MRLLRHGEEAVLSWTTGTLTCHVVAAAGRYVLLAPNGRILAYLAQHAQIRDRRYADDRVEVLCRLPRRCLDYLFEHGAAVRQNGQRSYA